MAEIIDYPGDFFVWFDETGIRYQIRYQIRGLPPVYHRYLSSEGLIAHKIM